MDASVSQQYRTIAALSLLIVGGGLFLGLFTLVPIPFYCALNNIPIIGGFFASGSIFQCYQNNLIGLTFIIVGSFMIGIIHFKGQSK